MREIEAEVHITKVHHTHHVWEFPSRARLPYINVALASYTLIVCVVFERGSRGGWARAREHHAMRASQIRDVLVRRRWMMLHCIGPDERRRRLTSIEALAVSCWEYVRNVRGAVLVCLYAVDIDNEP